MKKAATLLLALALSIVSLRAQDSLKVQDFHLDPSMTDAVKFPVKDFNDDPCALIRMGLIIPDAKFEGDIVKAEYKNGEWWLYMLQGATWLTVLTDYYLPLRYEFEALQGNATYVMTVVRPQLSMLTKTVTIHIQDEKRQRKNVSVVRIDDKSYSPGSEVTADLRVGPHTIVCWAAGYPSDTTEFTVTEETDALTITMHPFCATVTIVSNQKDWRFSLSRNGASHVREERVAGDRVMRNLNQGEYVVRLTKDGFKPATESFSVISNDDLTIHVNMQRDWWLTRSTPEFGWHFVELGGLWAQGLGWGADATYAFVPSHLGGYLTAGASFAGAGSVAGLVMGGGVLRLTDGPRSVDWQLFAGGGYHTQSGPVLNFGTRLAWDATERGFAPWSISAGALHSAQGWGGTLGLSLGLCAAPFYGGYTLVDKAIESCKRNASRQRTATRTPAPARSEKVQTASWLSESQSGFSDHFLEFGLYLMLDDSVSGSGGFAVSYTHISSHLGWYAMGGVGYGFLGVGGAVLRLSSSSYHEAGSTDWQLYTGAGYCSYYGEDDTSTGEVALHFGMRLGVYGEKKHAICPYSFSLGGLVTPHGVGGVTATMSWRVGLGLIAVGLLAGYASGEL